MGCGNDSPARVKSLRPDLWYIGLDILGDDNQTKPTNLANEYIITAPESFADRIRDFEAGVDAVVSAHNLRALQSSGPGDRGHDVGASAWRPDLPIVPL